MRLLVVEDESKVLNFLKQGLEDEKYIVDTASDGIAGLEIAMNNHFDAIILDVMLPGKDGFTILRELRDAGISTPILMLTARTNVEDKVAGLSAGADDYLAKPFEFDELIARIRALLRRSVPEKTTKLRCGELTLDTITHIAYRAGREIELTSKEYTLLEYLMRNKNRILSRSTITQHVWRHNFDTDSNIIDVYIKRLRLKIDGDNDKPLIQSVRGVGYRMREIAADE
ncbi:MAG TPA: response regulator transcription factor [Candidatus Kapabacteria bacterium]|nr:response regulator transcription factor [Candidatus Kapabacteria bacterium]